MRLRSKWYYITSLGGNLPLLRKLLAHAKKQNAKVSLTLGGRELAYGQAKLLPLLRRADVLIQNQEEMARLTSVPYRQPARIERRLRKLLPGTCVMTCGIRGAVALTSDTRYKSDTHRSWKRVEVTGAGDAFGSGFIASIARRPNDLPAALQFATANAESVVQHTGAKAGILRGQLKPYQRVRVSTPRLV